jgi:hypothetical protein
MPETGALLQALGIVGVTVVLLWFALGTQLNIRKAGRAMRWLQSGLPVLGPRTTLRWLGSSVAELKIVEPRNPFRAAIAMIVLEPRDLSALWALSRGGGRRDFLLLRLDLVRAPRYRADLIDPRAWTARDKRHDDAPFSREESWTDGAGARVVVRHDGAADVARLQALWERIGHESGGTWRISVRPLVPHVEVHVLFPPFETDARTLLGTVRELAEAVAAPR